MDRGMFVHAWDTDVDADLLTERFLEVGCNTLAVALNYHHIGAADLRLEHVHYERTAGTAFSVNQKRYGRIYPEAQGEREERLLKLTEKSNQKGLRFKAWVVNSHNSTLGQKYPELRVKNVWGDFYSNAICLNKKAFWAYERDLLEDIESRFSPESYIMEAVEWMPAFHGEHHEFMLARMTPAIRYLLSMCFCESCMEKAELAGIDGEKVAGIVKQLLRQLLREDTASGKNEELQMTQLFLEYPELYEYQRFRMNSVTELVKETAELVHSFGKKYEYIPSSTPFNINASYYEGYELRRLEGLIDGYIPLIYETEDTYDKVLNNIRLFDRTTPVGMGVNLGRSRYRSRNEFVERVETAGRRGAYEILSYNYGMATDEMLDWMKTSYTRL